MVNELLPKSLQVDFDLTTMSGILEYQAYFQKQLGNALPESCTNVSFENVQSSLSHNIYQNIELQELMEADIDSRKEELIDYLLFMFNKYLYLGIDIDKLKAYSPFDLLYSRHTGISFYVCSSLAQTEQQLYMSLIRKYTTFKPWKVRNNETCTESTAVFDAFLESLDIFKQMSSVVFSSYQEFYESLIRKLRINIDRQNSGY